MNGCVGRRMNEQKGMCVKGNLGQMNSPTEHGCLGAEWLGSCSPESLHSQGMKGRYCYLDASSSRGNVGDRGKAQKSLFSAPRPTMDLALSPTHNPADDPPLHVMSPVPVVSCRFDVCGLVL